MQNLNLNYNRQVEFFEENHCYLTNDGKYLQGITGIISKMLFPDKYSNIPQHILNKAAEYGTLIHSKCQANDMFETSDCIEVENYSAIKKENGLIPVENEYLVSDNERIATMIDNVFKASGSSVHLGEIKTTSVLDIESLSWQLSICAYLFELQNPHLKVDRLYGIWLRKDKHKLQKVNRIDNSIILSLIDAWFNETEFVNPVEKDTETSPEIEDLIAIDEEIAVLDERRKQLLSVIQPAIEKQQYKDDRVTISWVDPTSSVGFDAAKFKKENPELADKYKKETPKAGYMKVTYKQNKDKNYE
ncbi:MAG: hypothetical protein LBL79_02495 [Prevotella sp.]|nr:hypothetical protein [Prevotella sp.]